MAEPTATVGIENFTFEPEEITVPAGSMVTWVNHDDIPHVVVSDDKLFKSQPMDTDDAYTKRSISRAPMLTSAGCIRT